jgi:hypothetical protein
MLDDFGFYLCFPAERFNANLCKLTIRSLENEYSRNLELTYVMMTEAQAVSLEDILWFKL